MPKECIVITATSKGIGQELKDQLSKNFFIISINRYEKEEKTPKTRKTGIGNNQKYLPG